MRNRTFVVVLLLVALIAAAAVTMRGAHGGAMHRWFASIHGR